MATAVASRHREAAVSHLAEIRRLRGELAAVTADRDRLAAMLGELLSVGADDSVMWRQLAAGQYELGRAAGYDQGRTDEAIERDRAWVRIASPVAHGLPVASLERARWGEAGREHFADARPGDFPGRGEVTR